MNPRPQLYSTDTTFKEAMRALKEESGKFIAFFNHILSDLENVKKSALRKLCPTFSSAATISLTDELGAVWVRRLNSFIIFELKDRRDLVVDTPAFPMNLSTACLAILGAWEVPGPSKFPHFFLCNCFQERK